MNDRPTMAELVSAARVHLEGLIPTLTDARQRFQTLIAANVLSIVERELESEEEQLLGEWKLFAELLNRSGPVPQRIRALRQSVREANQELCEAICAGAFDEPARFRHASRLVRTLVERKLEIANPRYLRGFKDAEQ
jgi:hypothetical protein